LGCSALARAGQQLSVASSPDQVRAALENVATQLESDPILAGLVPVDEIAQKCRETATCPDAGALVSGCRLMATSLARRASSLAAEVQQRAKAASETPSASAPSPGQAAGQPEGPRPVAADGTPAQVPPTSRSPVAEPASLEVGAPVGSRPVAGSTPTLAPVTRSSPSSSGGGEDAARVAPVGAALEPVAPPRPSGQRFRVAGRDVVVDGRTNRMWLAVPLPGMKHAAAKSAVTRLGSAGHRDWRLPTLAELDELLGEGGLQALRNLGVLPGAAAPRLWSSDLRSRFFGLLKSVGVVSAATGEASRCSPGDASVRTLAVRIATAASSL